MGYAVTEFLPLIRITTKMGYAVTEFFIWCVSHGVGLMQITSFYLVSIVVDRHSCVVTSCCSCIKFIIYLNKINSFYTLVVFLSYNPFAYLFLKTGETPASTNRETPASTRKY